MLVADALDVVLAIAVVEQGRAFGRLDRDDLGAQFRLEVIAGGECAGRSRGRDKRGEPQSGGPAASAPKTRSNAGAGADAMIR